MKTDDPCPRCGAVLAGDVGGSGDGTCPACLMQLALETPASKPARQPGSDRHELKPGETVGPYRVVRLIGEGGMGSVYLAEQTEPVARQVALKVIKHGMDTEQVVTRFEIERQALALMNHPSIARVLDVGQTSTGLPYFVMDYIEGEPITDYCDRKRLTLPARLELFIQVCEAVQHAHQKGVIHRDIKPTNVLVADQDGKPLCKVIDFGVAKAIDQHLTERSLFTEIGVLIGTPEYMSPEQAELTLIDVDTRSDVYSLGVMLYNLITGFLPLDREELRSTALAEVLRRVREDRPSRPSTRISEAGQRAVDPARMRSLDVSGLCRLVAGDLDVITLKALEKDRERRYGSAAELAADVVRHLRHEPVLARPPSLAYHLRKLIVRHKLAATMSTLALVALIGVSIAMSLLYRDSQSNLTRALEAETTYREVSRFMVGVFDVSDPNVARGNSVTARELLDQARVRIAGELAGQPRVQAMLMAKMGEVHLQLGLLERAEPLLKEAIENLEQLYGTRHEETLRAMSTMGQLQDMLGNWDEAELLLGKTLATQTELFGADHPDTLLTRGNLGASYFKAGQLDEAETLLEATLDAERKLYGDEHRLTLFSMNNLANLYLEQGRFEEAEVLLNEALETFDRVFGEDHPGRIYVLYNLGRSQRLQKNYAATEPFFRKMLEASERILGENHAQTLGALNGLAILHAQQGQFEQAEPLWLEAIARQKKIGREDHPDTLSWSGNLAYMYSEQGRPDKAEPLLVQVLKSKRATMGLLHPKTLNTLMNLVEVYVNDKRPETAEPLLVETIDAWRLEPTGSNPMIGVTLYTLANVMRDDGRHVRASALYDEAQQLLESLVDPGHPYLETLAAERVK